jgi:hypothetical protein
MLDVDHQAQARHLQSRYVRIMDYAVGLVIRRGASTSQVPEEITHCGRLSGSTNVLRSLVRNVGAKADEVGSCW